MFGNVTRGRGGPRQDERGAGQAALVTVGYQALFEQRLLEDLWWAAAQAPDEWPRHGPAAVYDHVSPGSD